MLRPQDAARRDIRALDGLWDFALDTEGRGQADGWESGIPQSRRMAVPGSWNDIFTTQSEREFFGDAWYQRRVKVPNGWTEQVVLYFESVTHTATVFVDDTRVAEHQGGYLPFEVDITSLVSPGAWFTLTVIANNLLTYETIPPGTIQGDVVRTEVALPARLLQLLGYPPSRLVAVASLGPRGRHHRDSPRCQARRVSSITPWSSLVAYPTR